MKKTALITGGTSGLGEVFAYHLAKKGFNIVIVGRNTGKAKNILEKIQQYHVTAKFICAYIANKDDLETLLNEMKKINNLYYLINGAGFGTKEELLHIQKEKSEEMIQVHCVALMKITYTGLEIMTKNNEGKIINISSIASFLPFGSPLYTSTKLFVRCFSEHLFHYYKNKNIFIQALCPGYTKTNFFDTYNGEIPKNYMDAEVVVNLSLKASNTMKCVYIPGFKNKVFCFLLSFLPNFIIIFILKKQLMNGVFR